MSHFIFHCVLDLISTLFFTCSIKKITSKIGEGVYSEVFAFKDKQSSSVIKIIPIEGSEIVNGEKQKTFEEVLSELVAAK